MAISIKPQKDKKYELPGSFNILFYYSIIILFFALSAYLLVNRWNENMQEQIQSRESVLQRLEQQSEFQQNKLKVHDYRSKVNNYSDILSARNSVEGFFLFLENSIHPLAHWQEVRLDAEERRIDLEGNALDFDALEQQHSILKNFSMEKEFTGWVDAEDVEEIAEDRLSTDGRAVSLYNKPTSMGREEVINLRDAEEILILQKISEEDYEPQGLRVDIDLIEGEWYEVLAKKDVSPVDDIELRNVGETDEELRVMFELILTIDPIIFK